MARREFLSQIARRIRKRFHELSCMERCIQASEYREKLRGFIDGAASRASTSLDRRHVKELKDELRKISREIVRLERRWVRSEVAIAIVWDLHYEEHMKSNACRPSDILLIPRFYTQVFGSKDRLQAIATRICESSRLTELFSDRLEFLEEMIEVLDTMSNLKRSLGQTPDVVKDVLSNEAGGILPQPKATPQQRRGAKLFAVAKKLHAEGTSARRMADSLRGGFCSYSDLRNAVAPKEKDNTRWSKLYDEIRRQLNSEAKEHKLNCHVARDPNDKSLIVVLQGYAQKKIRKKKNTRILPEVNRK